MARSQKIQTNFTAGELSPRLLGRVDIARYQNAAAIMEGYYPLVYGGANRHPGLRFVAATKYGTKESIAVAFVFSATQAYVLEFGDLYMRVFKDGGQVESSPGVPYEIVTPYAEADLEELNWVQSADTMFLVHPRYPIRRLTRSGHAAWKLAVYTIVVEPHEEIGTKPAANVTLGAVSGSGVTATGAATVFEAADVGRQITSGNGVATIVGYTSTTVVTVDISDAFSAVLLTSGNWTLTESPKATLTPSVAGPEGAAINLTLSAAGWKSAPTTDIARYVHINGGVVEITGFTSTTVVAGKVRSALTGTTPAPAASWSMETRIWNATNGYPRAVTLFEQRLVVAGSTAYPNRVWGTRTARYNDFTTGGQDNDGLDLDMVSDQQNPVQHLAALKALLPLTYGGEFSVRGGVEKPLTSSNNQTKPESQYGIKNVRPVRVGPEILYVQRSGRKIRSIGYRVDSDAFASPDRTKLSEHITVGGIEQMAYSQEPDSIVWMVRADGQAVTLSINMEEDAQVLGWSRRPTDGEFRCFAVIPYNDADQVWAIVKRTINSATVRNMELCDSTINTDSAVTGGLLPIAINAIGWLAGVVTVTTLAPHGLGAGSYGRISGVTPTGYNGDKLCTAGTAGSTIKYSLGTDPGVATVLGEATPLAIAWAGFGHLEAEQLDVVADGGIVFPSVTVSGGVVTLPRAVASIEAGLHYESRIKLLNPELAGSPDGTTQGRAVSVSEFSVRFYQTVGGAIRVYDKAGNLKSEEDIPFRRFGVAVLDKPVSPFTGDKKVNLLGWDEGTNIDIVQNQPLPSQVLAAIYKVTVND